MQIRRNGVLLAGLPASWSSAFPSAAVSIGSAAIAVSVAGRNRIASVTSLIALLALATRVGARLAVTIIARLGTITEEAITAVRILRTFEASAI